MQACKPLVASVTDTAQNDKTDKKNDTNDKIKLNMKKLIVILLVAIMPNLQAQTLIPFQSEKGRWGFKNIEGEVVVEAKYYQIVPLFSDNFYAAKKFTYWGLIDSTGKEIAELKYDKIGDCSEGLALVGVEKQEGTSTSKTTFWGYIDKSGKEVIPVQYKYPKTFSEGLAAVNEEGYINTKGEWAIEPKFINVGSFKNGLAPAAIPFSHKGMGYINTKGEWVIPEKFHRAYPFEENGFAVIENDKDLCGIIDRQGNFVLKPKYVEINFIANDVFSAKNKAKKYEIVSITGKNVVKTKFLYVNKVKASFGNYFIAENEDGIAGLYDTKGNTIMVAPQGTTKIEANYLSDEMRVLEVFKSKQKTVYLYDKNWKLKKTYENVSEIKQLSNYLCMTINNENKVINPITFDFYHIRPVHKLYSLNQKTFMYRNTNSDSLFYHDTESDKNIAGYKLLLLGKSSEVLSKNGFIPVAATDGKVVFIDRNTREVKIKGTNIERADVGFSQIKILKNGKYGIIDALGKEIAPCKYDEIGEFKDGVAKVKQDDSWGIIEASGKEIVPCKLQEIGDFTTGYAAVKYDNNWGIIHVKGNVTVPFEYQNVFLSSNGYSQVKKANKWGIIHVSGREVTPCKYESIAFWKKGYAAVEYDGKHGLIDTTGKLIVSCKYDDIIIADEESFAVKSGYFWGLSDASDKMIVNTSFNSYNMKPAKGTIGLLKNLSSTKAMCYYYAKGKLIGNDEVRIYEVRSVLDDVKKQAASYATVDCPKCNGAGHNGYVKAGTKTCWSCGGTGLTGKTEKETKVDNVSYNTVTVRATVTTTETAQKCPYCYGRGYTGTPKDTENTCDLCNGEKKVSPSVKQTYLNNK